MPDYRLSAQIISRADGRSVVAAASYRSGAALSDARTGLVHDYTRKQGVLHTEIIAPDSAPAWAQDRETLWNRVEAAETRSNSQLAREIQISLPHELTDIQRLALTREFVEKTFVARGMVADIAIHAPSAEGDQRNHHAHVLLTTRALGEQGFTAKNRDWNSREHLVQWREAWAVTQNRHLEKALGRDAPKVSHLSYAERQIERIPSVHRGPTATAYERRHRPSEQAERARNAQARDERRQAAARESRHRNAGHAQLRDVRTVKVAAKVINITTDLKAARDTTAAQLRSVLLTMRDTQSVTVRGIEKASLTPYADAERLAKRELEQARDRGRPDLSTNRIMSWLRDPAGKMWQSVKSDIAIDSAARKLARARNARNDMEQWLKSPEGRARLAEKYRRLNPDRKVLRTTERRLRREIARLDRSIAATEKLSKVLLGLREAGLAERMTVPVKVLDDIDYTKTLNESTAKLLKSLKPEQARILQIALTPGLGRGR